MELFRFQKKMARVVTFLLFTGHLISSLAAAYEYPDFSNLDKNVYSTSSPGVLFRLGNQRGQIGSSGGIGEGVRGVLWHAATQEDIEQVLTGPAPNAPYIVLIDPASLSQAAALTGRSNLLALKASDKVAGIVIVHTFSNFSLGHSYLSANYSPVMDCDNEGFGWAGQPTCERPWNSYAQNFLHFDFGEFPVMLTENPSDMNSCFARFMGGSNRNSSWPLCAVEITADMALPVNTETCFRRAYLPMPYLTGQPLSCDILGGNTVMGTPFLMPNTTQDVVMVTTKLDTVSLFPRHTALGAGEAAGIVTLLAAAEAIGAAKRQGQLKSTNKSIMFTFFHGESWDYIGSSRMVYDMHHGDPLAFDVFKLNQISHFVELSHSGFNFAAFPSEPPIYYAHLHQDKGDILDSFQTAGKESNVMVVPAGGGGVVPPSSLLSFLARNASLSSVVLGDYNTSYLNRFYGSRFDTIDSLAFIGNDTSFNQSLDVVAERLWRLASTVAGSVVNLSDPVWDGDKTLAVDKALVRDLIVCFLRNFSCPRFQEAIPEDVAMPNSTVMGYVGIYRSRNSAPQTYLPQAVRNLLSYFLGDRTSNVTAQECANISSRSSGFTSSIFSRGPHYNRSAPSPEGVCVQANTFLHRAISPAFDADDAGLRSYDAGLAGRYSSWTESSWGSVRLRLYIASGIGEDVAVLATGVGLLAVFVVLSVQLHRKGGKLFHHRFIPPSSDPHSDPEQ